MVSSSIYFTSIMNLFRCSMKISFGSIYITSDNKRILLYIYIYIYICALWHINFCRLFNAKSIFIQINS